MVTKTKKTTLPWILLVVGVGCAALLVARENLAKEDVAQALNDERLKNEDSERRGRRLAQEVRRLRGTSTALLSPASRSADVPFSQPTEGVAEDAQEAKPLLSRGLMDAALREVLSEMEEGVDLRSPVRLGTHKTWLPVLDELTQDSELGIKAWYYQSLFPANDLGRVRALLAGGLKDDSAWVAAAGFMVAQSAGRVAAPLSFIDVLLGDDSVDVRVGGMAGLKMLMQENVQPEQAFSRVMTRVSDADDRVALMAIGMLEGGELIASADDSLTQLLQKTVASSGERRGRLISFLLTEPCVSAVSAMVGAAMTHSEFEVDLLSQVKSAPSLNSLVVAELAAFLVPAASEYADDWRAALGPRLTPEAGAPFDWNGLISTAAVRRAWSDALQSTVAGEDADIAGAFERRIAEAAATGQADRIAAAMDGVSSRRRAAAVQRCVFSDGVDVHVRRAGVDVLREAGTHLVLPALSHLLGDSDSQVRLRAATALAAYSVDAGIDRLAGIMTDDPEQRYEAMRALLDAKNDAAYTAALGVIETGDVLNTWFLVDDFIQTKRPLPEESIRKMLTGGVVNQWRADSYLGCFEASLGEELNGLLAGLLVASEIPESIQHVVIRWLASSGEPQLSGLLGRFLDSEVELIREATLHALSRLDGKAVSIDRLLNLTGDADPFVLAQLCYCLASIKNPMATNALVTLTKHKFSAVREVATRVLGGRRHPTVLPALKGRLSEDDDIDVVNAALMSLLMCGQYDHMGQLFQQVDLPWVGPRSLRFLQSFFGRDLTSQQDWVAWWELNGTKWAEARRQ